MHASRFSLALAASLVLPMAASAAIVVDGAYDTDYGSASAVVTYVPATNPPTIEGNFATPTPFSDAIGYSIYTAAENGEVYAYLRASGPGASVGPFANLYYDVDPQNNNGSDILFSIGGGKVTEIVAGASAGVSAPGAVTATSADGLGIEVSIPNADFEGPVSGLTFGNQQFATLGSPVVLRLSQSFGYSVAGGPLYGPDRLGAVILVPAAPTPEPASWALMLIGVAGLGSALRSRRGSPRTV